MSIPPSGQILLEPKMVTGMTNLNNVIVFLAGRNEPILDCREANTEVQYFLRDTVDNLECWGIVLVEDKQEFEVVCNDGLIPCINGLDSLNPEDFVTVIDNCLTLDDLTVTYTDGPLDLFPTPSDTIGEVLRKWILSDDNGVIRECNSIIYLEPLSCDSLIIPRDTTIYCGQDPRDFDITGYLNYTEEQLVQNCHIAVNTCIRDSFPFNCGSISLFLLYLMIVIHC